MCGIAGLVAPERSGPGIQSAVRDAMAKLRHRGPDDSGYEALSLAARELCVGHTRLSIIDLSAGGHQPMHSEDGRFTLVYNGEIYNYRELRQELEALGRQFRTETDTEVLLAAWAQWGVSGIRRLVGMFAFAVFDKTAETLTLVRDAFGIKPLYYYQTEEQFGFASEAPALLALLPHKSELNYQRAYDYLVYGRYDMGSETFYQGIHHLLPGHWLEVDLRSLRDCEPVRWWWPLIGERGDLPFAEAAAQLREIFLNSVRLHMRSDVPLGAALSGGIDSSAVVCAMRYLEPSMPIHTFSYVARGSDVDEEAWIDLVNDHVGAIAHKVVVDPKELAQDLDEMIAAQGEPFGSTSIYAQYRVFKAARQAGITVMLDGQGADEILAGYNGYPEGRILSLVERGRFIELFRFLRAWARWPGRDGRQALTALGGVLTPVWARKSAYRLAGRSPEPAWLRSAWLKEAGVRIEPVRNPVRTAEGYRRRLVEQLRNAMTGSRLAALLRHGDRNSMRWSIESRVPFLTTELAEFVLSLPEEYLLSQQGETKHIFRAAMRGIVPDAILDRQDKIGFQTPEYMWLKQSETQVEGWLDRAEQLPFVNKAEAQACINQFTQGITSYNSSAWALINYCRWAGAQQCCPR